MVLFLVFSGKHEIRSFIGDLVDIDGAGSL